MANIENQIDQISTAFYGSQVRGAIVEGLESINEEVNSLNDNIVQVDDKTEKMSKLVNSSTEEMKELVNEYQNVNTKAQKTFQQIDGIMAKAMNEPTINAGILKNCDLENGGIHGTITNQGTIEHGLISKANFEDCAIVGTLDNAGTINGGKLNGGTLNECKIEDSVISSSTIEGGVLKSIGLSGDINNYGGINGGKISNATLDTVNIVGDVNNFTNIKGGEYENSTLVGENIINKGTINGGIYKDSYLVTPSLNVPTLNNSILPGNTNLNGIMRINEHTGAVYYLDNNSNPCVEEAIDGATWFIRNKYTGNNMIQSTPVSSGKDTLEIDSNVTVKGQVSVNNAVNFNYNPNFNCQLEVHEENGSINFLNSNNVGISKLSVTNDTFMLANTQTKNAMISVNPVSSGTDTLQLYANVGCNDEVSISNPTLTGKVNINNGLLVDGSPVVQNFKTITGTINFSSTVRGDFSATFWTFNGSLLSSENQGNSNSNQLGLLSNTLIIKGGSIKLDPNDVIQLQFDEIPNFGAMPMELATTGAGKVWDSPIFKTTLFNNTLSFIFPGPTLQEGATYGAYALIIGNQY